VKIFFYFLLAFSSCVQAGSYGLSALFHNIGDPQFQESRAFNKFKQNFEDGSLECWGRMGNEITGLTHIVGSRKPEGLDLDLGNRIWAGDMVAISKALSIISNPKWKDDEKVEGFYDGLFVFKPHGQVFEVLALGTWHSDSRTMEGEVKKVKVILSKDAKKAARQFEEALCKAAYYNVKPKIANQGKLK
jgi:hypothetical protein